MLRNLAGRRTSDRPATPEQGEAKKPGAQQGKAGGFGNLIDTDDQVLMVAVATSLRKVSKTEIGRGLCVCHGGGAWRIRQRRKV